MPLPLPENGVSGAVSSAFTEKFESFLRGTPPPPPPPQAAPPPPPRGRGEPAAAVAPVEETTGDRGTEERPFARAAAAAAAIAAADVAAAAAGVAGVQGAAAGAVDAERATGKSAGDSSMATRMERTKGARTRCSKKPGVLRSKTVRVMRARCARKSRAKARRYPSSTASNALPSAFLSPRPAAHRANSLWRTMSRSRCFSSRRSFRTITLGSSHSFAGPSPPPLLLLLLLPLLLSSLPFPLPLSLLLPPLPLLVSAGLGRGRRRPPLPGMQRWPAPRRARSAAGVALAVEEAEDDDVGDAVAVAATGGAIERRADCGVARAHIPPVAARSRGAPLAVPAGVSGVLRFPSRGLTLSWPQRNAPWMASGWVRCSGVPRSGTVAEADADVDVVVTARAGMCVPDTLPLSDIDPVVLLVLVVLLVVLLLLLLVVAAGLTPLGGLEKDTRVTVGMGDVEVE